MIIRKEVMFLLVFLVGLNILFGIIIFSEPKISQIKDINENMIDKKLAVEGNIISSVFFNDSSFEIINIKDETGSITGVFNTKTKQEFNKTLNYVILGKVSLYKNETQLSVEKISIR